MTVKSASDMHSMIISFDRACKGKADFPLLVMLSNADIEQERLEKAVLWLALAGNTTCDYNSLRHSPYLACFPKIEHSVPPSDMSVAKRFKTAFLPVRKVPW